MTQILEILEELNPWWLKKKIDTGINRKVYLDKITSYLTTNEIIILNGIRRSGKTTLLFQTIVSLLAEGIAPKNILFVNFDQADLSNLKIPVREILDVYFQEVANEGKCYLIFDEIQNVENWEKWAKSIYDEKKHQLILSGSSSQMLNNQLATRISGRYLNIQVTPLSFCEFIKFRKISIKSKLELVSQKNKIIKLFKEYIYFGGFPKISFEKDQQLKTELLKTYYDTIVYKDIILNNDIRQKKLMKELLYYLITNFTSFYSYKNLAKLFSVSYFTIREHFNFIENSQAFFSLPFFSYSVKTQNRNQKKNYSIDTGLRNAVSFKFSKDEGKLVENLVFVELKRLHNNIFYWHNSKKQEVDFVVKNKDDSLDAINVSYTNEINEREINGLIQFKKEFKKSNKLILLTKDLEKIENEINFIPVWKWLIN